MYDLNRVEVLRGPQGTLYGSGSMGGTIKVVPNAPDPSGFDSSVEAIVGGTNGGGFNNAENAMVNLPIGNGIAALRIVGSYEDDSGWIDRIVENPFPLPTNGGATRGNVLNAPVAADYKGVNEMERTTVRISALVTPLDGLTVTPSFLYQKLRSPGLPYVDSVPGTDAHYQPFDVAEPFHDEFDLGSLKVDYKTEAFDINSTTSYWRRYEPVVQDASESWQTGLGLTSFDPATGGIGSAVAIEDNNSHQTTEEIRLSSVGETDLKWLIGYFYQDFESTWDVYFPAPGAVADFGSPNLFDYHNPTKILQQSVFGELTYNFTKELAFTAGARRYQYDESSQIDQSGALTSTSATSSAATAQGVTPKFSLSYQASADTLLYATAAKGFRPGGGTGPVPTSGPAAVNCEAQLQSEYGTTSFVPGPTSFQPDSVWSYEIGEKMRLADNRITINGALYAENWNGVQQTNSLSSCGYIYTANAGNAHVYGGELEVHALVTNELVASVNTGYVHAFLVSTNLLNAGFDPGTPIQDDPRWTASAQLAYKHQLSADLAFTARAESTFVGSRTDETYSINTLPGYDLTNVRGGIEGSNWSASLFVNNVANKRAVINDVTQAAVNIADYNRQVISQPLTAGIDLTYRFGR